MWGGLEAALSMNQHPHALLCALRGKAKVGGGVQPLEVSPFHVEMWKGRELEGKREESFTVTSGGGTSFYPERLCLSATVPALTSGRVKVHVAPQI